MKDYQMNRHAVVVDFEYVEKALEPLFQLERQLHAALLAGGVGELNGSEMRADLREGSVCLEGQDADAVFRVAQPILEQARCIRLIKVTLRYGPPDGTAAERVVEFGG